MCVCVCLGRGRAPDGHSSQEVWWRVAKSSTLTAWHGPSSDPGCQPEPIWPPWRLGLLGVAVPWVVRQHFTPPEAALAAGPARGEDGFYILF